ncbi:interleukin-5 receptor subunit alpha-like [Heptranchias perlo]|uniref:interleukin-5 receptor subunit alpha-like n=1 Tax=Heptranchias perlo TaxID=212740 RepID=UPI003559BF76
MLLAPSFLIMAIIWTITVNGTALTSSKEMSNQPCYPLHDNLSCIFYDNSCMNCTWEINEKAPPDAQYRLFYTLKYSKKIKNCTNYHKNGRRNVTCHVQKFELNPFDKATICVAESSQKLTNPYCKDIVPVICYKSSPPINVKVTESEVEWEHPGGKHPSNFFFYQIRITDWSNNVKKIENVQLEKWNIGNRMKSYSVQVRARINNGLHGSLWSDWSQPVNIEPEQKDLFLLKISIAVAVTFVAMVLLLMFICRRFRLLENLCQPIPDPKQKFKDLFEYHNGDFQKWCNAHYPVAKVPEECIPVTVED